MKAYNQPSNIEWNVQKANTKKVFKTEKNDFRWTDKLQVLETW